MSSKWPTSTLILSFDSSCHTFQWMWDDPDFQEIKDSRFDSSYCGFERVNGGDKTNFRLYLRGALFIFCPFRKQIANFSSQRGFLHTQSTNNNCSGHTLVLCLQSGTPSVCSPPLVVPANCAHFWVLFPSSTALLVRKRCWQTLASYFQPDSGSICCPRRLLCCLCSKKGTKLSFHFVIF